VHQTKRFLGLYALQNDVKMRQYKIHREGNVKGAKMRKLHIAKFTQVSVKIQMYVNIVHNIVRNDTQI
jgi:hypothetical protein